MNMLVRGELPTQASCVGWLAAIFLLFVVLLRWEPDATGVCTAGASSNKLALSSDLVIGLSPDPFSATRRGGGSREEDGRRPSRRGMKSVHPWSSTPVASVLGRWRLLKFSSPRSESFGGRWPATGALLLHLLVEWQPSFISSRPECLMGGSSAPGRRPCLLSPASRRRCCCGELITPSGFVPGGNWLGSILEFVAGIELQFTFQIWGAFCKMQGLVCNFVSTLGPYVICACSVSINI